MSSCPASSGTILPLAPYATKPFSTFPWRVDQGGHLWVPPLLLERTAFLNPRKNPFFQHAQVQLFLAQQGKETVGRITAVLHQTHDRCHHEHAGFFGVCERIPEAPGAAMSLLQAAEAWARELRKISSE